MGEVAPDNEVTILDADDEKLSFRQKMRICCSRPSTYPMIMFCVIGLFLSADQNLMAPSLTPIAEEFNFTSVERDTRLGGEIAVGLFVVGGTAATVVSFLTDCVNRIHLFSAIVFLGELSCFCTLFVTDFTGLFWTRAFTGMSIGGALPILMSLVGDYFTDKERGKATGVLMIMIALGTLVGQVVASIMAPSLGWRAPFVAVSIPSMLLAVVCVLTVKEPERGSMEKTHLEDQDLTPEEIEAMAYTEKISFAKLKDLFSSWSFWLIFAQGLPGSLPWGIMLTFFQDFLINNKSRINDDGSREITTENSSLVVIAFGFGAGIGQLIGGYYGDKLWNRKYEYVPYLMSATTALGTLPLYFLVNAEPLSLIVYIVLALPAGTLVAITGSVVKSVLLNVTIPEVRGSAFSVYTLADDLGRGLGPFFVSQIVAAFAVTNDAGQVFVIGPDGDLYDPLDPIVETFNDTEEMSGRIPAYNIGLAGWLVGAIFLFLLSFTVRKDLAYVKKHVQEKMGKMPNNEEPGKVIQVSPTEETNEA